MVFHRNVSDTVHVCSVHLICEILTVRGDVRKESGAYQQSTTHRMYLTTGCSILWQVRQRVSL